MSSALKILKFFARPIFRTVGWAALVGLPLVALLTLWTTSTLKSQRAHTCSAQVALIQKSIASEMESLNSNLTNTLSDAQGHVLMAQRFKNEKSSWKLEWESWNQKLAAQLRISRVQLLKAGSSSLRGSVSGAQRAIMPLEISGSPLWQISFHDQSDTLVVAHVHSGAWLNSLENVQDCKVEIATSDYWIYPRFQTSDTGLFSTYWRDPLARDSESMKLFSTFGDDVEIRRNRPQFVIAGRVPRDLSTPKDLAISLLLGLAIVTTFIIVLSIPKWSLELKISERMSETLDDYKVGRYDSRPRLFLKNHFAKLEKAISDLGDSLSNSINAGALLKKWKKSGKTNLSSHRICYVSVHLPTLSKAISDVTKRAEILEEIRSSFVDSVLQNNGTIEGMNHETLTAIWGYLKETEDDASNATMAAVQFRSKMESVWKRGIPMFNVGIVIHYGPVVFQIVATDELQEVIPVGDVVDNTIELSRFASQQALHPLVTEAVQTQIENYFVLSPYGSGSSSGPGHGNTIKLFSVLGYVDSQENPVLTKTTS